MCRHAVIFGRRASEAEPATNLGETMTSEENSAESTHGGSRRDFLRKGLIAGGVAATAPLVTTFGAAAGAQVTVGSKTTYSFQYTRASGNSCTAVTSTTAFASTASSCELSGFTSGENTQTNAAAVSLTVTNCPTAPVFTLPGTSSCTFGTGAVTTRSGSNQICKTDQSSVSPTNNGKTLTFATLNSNEILRFTVTC